jgi:hypothetical protein
VGSQFCPGDRTRPTSTSDNHKPAHERLGYEHAVEWILVEKLELLGGKRVRFREWKTFDP